MANRSIGGVFLCLLILVSFIYIGNDSNLIHRTAEKQNVENNILPKSTSFEFYDVNVTDSLINGTVLLEGESRVLLENVNITGNSVIVAIDNASLRIRNSMVESLNILVSDGAKVYIDNLSTYSGYIYASGHSEVYINGIHDASYLNVMAYGMATIYVTGEVANYTQFNIKENARFFGRDITAKTDWAVNFRAFGNALINVSYILDTGINGLTLYENSVAYVSESNISSINMHDKTSFYVYNSYLEHIFIESGEWFYIYGSTVGNIDNQLIGSNGRIENSVVSYLSLLTKSIVDLINSDLNFIQFIDVFNDSLVINSSGWFYESRYVNYNNISSHVNTTNNVTTTYIVVVNSPLFSINVDMNIDSIAAINVSNINISFASFELASMYFANTHINFNMVNVSSPALFVYPEINIINSSALINSSYLGDLSKLYIEDSDVLFTDSTIECTTSMGGTFVHISRSYVALISSMIVGNVYIEDIRLENGNFSMMNGLVSVYSGSIIYGVEGIAESGISGLVEIDAISVSHSFIEIRDMMFDSFSPLSVRTVYTSIYAYNSSVLLNNTYSDLSIPVYLNLMAVNNSRIGIYNSNITNLSIQYGLVEVANANISTINLADARLNVSSSHIDTIDASNNSFIYMTDSVLTGELAVWEEDFGQYIYANVTIKHSNVSNIYLICFGSAKIVNSTVGNVMGLFAELNIINSTVNSASKIYQIVTSGYVEIVNNVIPSGSYRVLLNSSNSNINSLMEGIVFAGSDLYLNLTNTSYFMLVVSGENTNVSITDSTINAVSVMATNVIINNSLIDASMMHGQPIIFMADMVEIYNASIYSSGPIYISPSGPPTGNITGYVEVENSRLGGGFLYVGDSELNMSGADLMGLSNISLEFAPFKISNTNVSCLFVRNSKGQLTNLRAHMILLDDNSNVSIANSDINLTIMRFWQIYGSVLFGESVVDFNFTRNMYLNTYDSKINIVYTEFYHVDSFLRVYFDNDTITGSYTTKSRYVNTGLGEFQITLFEVTGRGKATIMNYKDAKAISGLWVNVYIDSEPPSIVPLNGSYLEYEYGLEYNLLYELHDRTPTYYYVLLNGSVVDSGTYYDGYILTVSLPNIIHGAGIYNLSIKAMDSEERVTSVTTIINVFPSEPPEIYVSPNNTYNLTIGENMTLMWKARDKNPDMYYIYLNSTQVKSGSWISDEEIIYVFNASESGVYNITIVFRDIINNQRADSVIIYVKEATTTTTKKTLISPKTAITIVGVAIVVIIVAIVIFRKKR